MVDSSSVMDSVTAGKCLIDVVNQGTRSRALSRTEGTGAESGRAASVSVVRGAISAVFGKDTVRRQ